MQCLNPYEGLGPCEDWDGSRTPKGYGCVVVEGQRWLAHRWVFFQAHGYLPPVVRHRCDRPPCVRLSHLLPGTQSDNLRDCLERGRARRALGLENGRAKLSDEQVAEIRARYPADNTVVLAAEYGVSNSHIWRIIAGERRKAGR